MSREFGICGEIVISGGGGGGAKTTVTHGFQSISSGGSGLLATISPVTVGNNVVIDFLAVPGGGAGQTNIEVKMGSNVVINNTLANTNTDPGNPMTTYKVGENGTIQRIVAPPDVDITITKTSGSTSAAISLAFSEEKPA